jgi:hypothetical protein
MAIQISGCTVIDNSRNVNAGIGTFTDLNVPPIPITFNPSDGATEVALNANIVITFNQLIQKGTGNITLRDGSAGGTVLQTIAVSNAAVTISGAVVTINPPSDLPTNTNVYVVVDGGAFTSISFSSPTPIINTYDFTTVDVPPIPALGCAHEGGFLICCSGSVLWIVAPNTSEVSRTWYLRNDANTRAQQVSGCTGWFVPTRPQLQNPGYTCRTFWDSFASTRYWSSTETNATGACIVDFTNGIAYNFGKASTYCVRAFRCVTY